MIASRSFLNNTNHHVQNPISEDSRVPNTYPSRSGESIYVHPTALKNFVHNYLPNIKFPFVLYSGDSDTTVPDDVLHEAIIVLDHPLLLVWYSQNCTNPSEKLKQLPIGLDLHTFKPPKPLWGVAKDNQLSELNSVRSINVQKQNKCYSNFHFLLNTRYAQDRRDAIDQVPKELVFYEPARIPRIQSWTNMVHFKYVLSPHGNGLDCHRTWEALILGCIPIVRTSPLDPLFEGLPVLIINEWSEVTQELLDSFVPNTHAINKLNLFYWIK